MTPGRPFLAPRPERPLGPAEAPTFSVVIAAYQAAEFAGEAVESALTQTSPPLEVIVADDGSTDDLAAALAPWRDRIVVLRNEHRGEAAAKNAGAAAATGDFVVLLDADDVYLPERLEALRELARARPDLDILTTDALLEVAGDVVRRCYTDSWPFPLDDQRGAILERNFVFGHAAVRRERLLAVGGFDPAMGVPDWECWIRLVLAGARVGLVAEPLSRYRLRETGLSSDRRAHLSAYVAALEKTEGHPALTPAERARLAETLRLRRRQLAEEEAEAALLEGRADARRRAVEVALASGSSLRTRAKAALAALAPGSARRVLARRERETWVGASGIRVARRSR
ncbi:MAG TPA: glycosyltransferase [Gaiellaceae bacterium]|nr:glycosyltransferase [Gaiellaceae bacterium]